jgi:hypothetical protein
MFPETFARESILSTTKEGDLVLDPFSGRGTTLLEALLNGRDAIACDINPVAAVVSSAKAAAPSSGRIVGRLEELKRKYQRASKTKLDDEARSLPKFFRHAYARSTLRQMLFLRRALAWRTSKRDEFITAVLLGHLHGESDHSPSYLSAQMPHTIAPKPAYAVRYWTEREIKPPKRDAFELLQQKIEYRLEKGVPERRGRVALSDARKVARRFKDARGKVAAVVTSPPYFDVTNFEEDQWLRLWFLGGEPKPTYSAVSHDDRYRGADNYFTFLKEVWKGIAPLLKRNAHLVCRIGARSFSHEEISKRLTETIRDQWSKAAVIQDGEASDLKRRQTNAFRPGTKGCGVEYDFVFRLGT